VLPTIFHLAVTVATSTSIGERIGIPDARIAEQAPADIELQDREIPDAVAKMPSVRLLVVGGEAGSPGTGLALGCSEKPRAPSLDRLRPSDAIWPSARRARLRRRRQRRGCARRGTGRPRRRG